MIVNFLIRKKCNIITSFSDINHQILKNHVNSMCFTRFCRDASRNVSNGDK